MFDLLDEYTISADSANFSPTTADQTLFSLNIPERKGLKYYLLHIDLYIATTATSVVQTLDLEIKNDNTIIKTFNYSPKALIDREMYSITYPVAKNTTGSISLQLGNAGSADAQTTVVIKDVWAAAVG